MGWLPILWHLGRYAVGYLGYVAMVKKVCAELAELNIFYVKIFQWSTSTSTSTSGIDARDPYLELPDFFETFRTQVPYNDRDLAYARSVAAPFGFGLALDRPIGSGTLALVFQGEYQGKSVAIKILRPGIRQQLKNLFWQLSFLRFIRFIRLLERDFKATFAPQVDFLQEAANMRMFQAAFRQNGSIRIPECYVGTSEMLIMDYFHPFPQTDWDALDYRAYSNLFHHFMVSCYFLKDLYHGDLHLGNIIFLKTGSRYQLGIIDFGLVGHLTVKSQNFIFHVFQAIVQKDLPGFLTHYADYITPDGGGDGSMLNSMLNLNLKLQAVLTRQHIEAMPLDSRGLIRLIRVLYTAHNNALDPNLNIYLFSVLALIETLNVLTSNDERPHRLLLTFDSFDSFDSFNA